jgi:hypothetical protein
MAETPDRYSNATNLAIAAQGRRPAWSTPTATDGPPETANAGVSLGDATVTHVRVDLRENVAYRTALITVDTLDLTATYGVGIDGTTASYNAGGAGAVDLEDVVEGIAAALNGNGTIAALVTATAIDTDDDDVPDAVQIVGDSDDNYAVTALSASGTGDLACEADACSAIAYVYFAARARLGSTAPEGWAWDQGAIDIDHRGCTTVRRTGGFDRMHVHVDEVEGAFDDASAITYRDPTVSIGPCLSEDGD